MVRREDHIPLADAVCVGPRETILPSEKCLFSGLNLFSLIQRALQNPVEKERKRERKREESKSLPILFLSPEFYTYKSKDAMEGPRGKFSLAESLLFLAVRNPSSGFASPEYRHQKSAILLQISELSFFSFCQISFHQSQTREDLLQKYFDTFRKDHPPF